MGRVWRQIEQRWPARWEGRAIGYQRWRDKASELLAGYSINAVGFSHYGVIVSSIEKALGFVATLLHTPLPRITAALVQVYEVQVTRFSLEGTELELIAPQGKSFFADYQRIYGEGLHHVSFQVGDVSAALFKLAAKCEVLVDSVPRSGSHGMVAFSAPKILRPLHLELYQSESA